MKLLIIAGILALTLAGCAGEILEAPENTTPEPLITTPEALVTTAEPPDEPAPLPAPDLSGLKAFELLGYFVDENEYIWFNYPDSNEYCPNAFNEYFLGSWDGDWFGENIILIIDVTERSSVGHDLAGRTVWVNDHVVAIPFPNNGVGAIYWLDINEPDKMYFTTGFGVGNGIDNQIASLGNIEEGWFLRAVGAPFTKVTP